MKKRKLLSLMLAFSLFLPFFANSVLAQEPEAATEEEAVEEVETFNFGARISFANYSGVQYESLAKENALYKSVIGAVITMTNQETGQVFTYTIDETGSHQYIPAGKYLMELKSVPEELQGKFEWPEAKEVEVRGSSFNGFNVVEIKVEDETEPTTTPETEPSTEATTEKPTSPSMSDKATKPADKVASTGVASTALVGVATLVSALGAAYVKRRK